nr:hypothetical protein [Desulfobulbus sp.]
MTPQLSTSESHGRGGVDHRLLLDRVHRAGFDDQGRDFVARVFAGGVFWEAFADAEVLGLAVVAQQHGLFDPALEALAWLNHERPQCG